MNLTQTKSGIILPAEKPAPPPKEPETHLMHGLIQSQLSRTLKMLDDAGAAVQCVFVQTNMHPFAGTRFTIVYVHTERFDTEIYT